MSDGAPITGAFAEFLEANRTTLNQQVVATSRQASGFDPAAFGDALRTTVARVVDAVDQRGEGFVTLVSQTLFDVALDLVAQRRFGGVVEDGWRRLLPLLVDPLTADPRALVAAVSNALVQLDRTPRAHPDRWIELLAGVAALDPDLATLLPAGQVAAWRSGMAAYRDQALSLAAGLDPAVATAALGLPADGESVAEVIGRLRVDPWFVPSGGGADPPPRIAVGSFRGFGGSFARPPWLLAAGDHVAVTDGTDRWAVFADAFGRAVIRLPGTGDAGLGGPAAVGPATGAPPAVLADVAELTSWAPIAGGYVATSALTHAVLFTRAAP